MLHKAAFALLSVAGLSVSSTAQATLFDRGSGLIYDDVLNITWLQDANYAKTRGDDPDGRMTWAQAMAWAAGLTYHDSVRSADLTGWRLPKTLPVNGVSYLDFIGYRGEADIGENVSAIGSAYSGSTGSELAYMFYVNLGNSGNHDLAGNHTGCSPTCLQNVGPFTNLQTYQYWSATEYTGTHYGANPNHAWILDMQDGFQGGYVKTWDNYAWAVRDGDVLTSVPEPDTILMLALGLAGLGAMRRRV